MPSLLVVGGGRMGAALVDGLVAAGWADAAEIHVVEASAARRDELAAAHGGGLVVTAGLPSTSPPPGWDVVIAVKPADVAGVCAGLAGLTLRRVVSLAAGIRLPDLERWLGADPGSGPGVVRAMPNTPALVGAGASAVAGGAGCGPDDLAWASAILAAVGTVTVVAEPLLDAVTGLSGSGPAYLFLVAEALIDAGVAVGLPRATASSLVVQTMLGAARMLAETGETPAELRAAVTSPGGTTAAGLAVLEAAAVRAALAGAVGAATERSRSLGG